MIVLGVDPGTRKAGYGLVELQGSRMVRLDSGVVMLEKFGSLPLRLAELHRALSEVVQQWKPEESAVEKVFSGVNVPSALALGQGRGVVLAVLGGFKIPVFEYAPNEIKKSAAGRGTATKDQVSRMVGIVLGWNTGSPDESDALAIAICHCNKRKLASLGRVDGVQS